MTTAALLILVEQPLYLTQSGFLFSFGAVCGIGFLSSVSRHFPVLSERFPVGNRFLKALFAGIWISLCTLPVYLCFYYEFPPYSVLLNLIVIPCMGALFLSGIAVMGAAACLLSLGRLAAVPGVWILTFYEKCATFALKLPGQLWVTGHPQDWQVAAYLTLLAAAVFFAGKSEKRKKGYFWCAVFCAVFLLGFRTPQGFEITMLDIGQGDCIYLADGQGGHYLIDGGSSDRKEVETYQIVPFLKYRGVSRGIPVRRLHEGDCLQNGKLMLTCLHPKKSYVNSDANAGSTVLYLTYENFSALFTGDLEGEGERLVTEQLAHMRETDGLPGQITLLKVAHHGSKNSTEDSFLEMVNPRIALVSAGRDNSYGHPHKETLERLSSRGCRIYRTTESGAVTVRVKSGGVRVEAYLTNERSKRK